MSSFKKGFLIWGIGSLLAIYFILKIFVGINSLGDTVEAFNEKEILKDVFRSQEITKYGKIEFLCSKDLDFLHEVHYFFVQDYLSSGPVIVGLRTRSYPKSSNDADKNFGVFPFEQFGSLEGLDYLDRTEFNGSGWLTERRYFKEEIPVIENKFKKIKAKTW